MRLPLVFAAFALSAFGQNEVVVEKIATGFHHLNGPVWSLDDVLLFSDTPTDRQFRFTPGKGFADTGTRAGGVSAVTFDSKGNMYVAEHRARRVTRTDKKGKVDVIAERFEGKRLNAPNDIVVRRDGNIYFTDPAFGEQQDSAELGFNGIFRISPKGELSSIARWKNRPNGITLSEDGRTLFVADSDGQSVHAFGLDKDGIAANDRVIISGVKGAPGGIRTDANGNLYVAAKAVFVYSPKGELVRTIELSEAPSNLAFGDPDFSALYVTAGKSLYRLRTGAKGTVPYLP